MRVIAFVFTGGTISMRNDVAAGGAVPSLSAEEILAAATGISSVCDARPEEWGRHPGPHMTVERQWALRNHLRQLVARPDIDGVVVTHGTDTLEETAYLIARSVPTEKPIVFTGAMRTASDLGWDGPANLLDAARVAASDTARGLGVVLVMGARVFTALDVMKVHTNALDAFESPGLGPIGIIDDGRVRLRRGLASLPAALEPEQLATPVDVVLAHAGADARLLDALRPEGQGVVIAALGRGNVPVAMVAGIERWIADGKPVVIASRSPRGRVGTTYGYPGSGRRLHELGAILAGSRRAPQARMELMLALGAGLAHAAIAEVLDG